MNTFFEYEKIVELLNENFGNMGITKITLEQLQDYLDALHEQGRAKSTINKRRLVLQGVFAYVNIHSTIKTINPRGIIKTPRMAKVSQRRTLTIEEVKSIIDNRTLPGMGFYCFCLLFLGLRRSEMLGLQWEDFDLVNGCVTISRVVIFSHNKPIIDGFLKNGWRDRILPLPDALLSELRFIAPGKAGYLFADDSGALPNESKVRRAWEQYRKNHNLPTVTLHMIRHAYATLLYDSDVDIKSAAALLGHSDERTTIIIYTHVNRERSALKAVKKINRHVSKSGFLK